MGLVQWLVKFSWYTIPSSINAISNTFWNTVEI